MDYYSALGLKPALQLDSQELQKLFHSRSRELHPDRFARAPKDVQQRALEESSLLNDAYRTLREPIARAEYFLQQSGFDIAQQRSKDVPPELLEEVFELNMALEELRSGDESARPQLAAAKANFQGLQAKIDSDLAQLFATHDGAPSKENLQPIRAILNRRRYIENLLRDVNEYLSN
jgi:molecular chaperone HscB